MLHSPKMSKTIFFKQFSLIALLSTIGVHFSVDTAVASTASTSACDPRTDIDSGTLTVPEDWNHPQGAKIKIFYQARNLKKIIQMANPILYLNGGPGYGATALPDYFKKYVPFSHDIPFIFMDQRGTGCSTPFPEVPITRDGATRLALYGTRNIVRDAEALRVHLIGNQKWSVFGQSFGSAIAHRYIAIAPEGLKAVYAHGFALMENGIEWVKARMAAQNRVSQEYLKQYPDDESTLLKLKAKIPADFCTGNLNFQTCGPDVLDRLAYNFISSPSSWKKLHQSITELDTDNSQKFLEKIRTHFPAVTSDLSITELMVATIPGRELPGGLLNTWSCKRAIQELQAEGKNPLNAFFNECREALATTATYDEWIEEFVEQDYVSLNTVVANLRSHPNLQFHLYSSELDTFAAKEGYAETVARLNLSLNFHFTHFATSGHNWLGEKKIWDDLRKD
jgi:pimeloyl-ACP methyl ester carboxylesterase